jgi:hypothetical protein
MYLVDESGESLGTLDYLDDGDTMTWTTQEGAEPIVLRRTKG